MKHPYLSAEMDIHSFDSCDIIHCSDSGEYDTPDWREDDDFVTTTATEEWVPSCNQGKPDYNAWS